MHRPVYIEECIVPFTKTLNFYRSKTFLELLIMIDRKPINFRSKRLFVRLSQVPEEIAKTDFYATPYTYVQIIYSHCSDTFMSHCMSLVDDQLRQSC